MARAKWHAARSKMKLLQEAPERWEWLGQVAGGEDGENQGVGGRFSEDLVAHGWQGEGE